MLKNKLTLSLAALAMSLVGMVGGTALVASAQGASTTTNVPATITTTSTSATGAVDTPESANDPADIDTGSKTHGHAPLGGDGVVSSVNGTTIVMGEESDEGGASYTIDASKATVMNNGVSGTLADIKVGEKIFVQGTTSGTNVIATSVSVGHHGEGADKANDTDGSAASEASEPASSSEASGQ